MIVHIFLFVIKGKIKLLSRMESNLEYKSAKKKNIKLYKTQELKSLNLNNRKKSKSRTKEVTSNHFSYIFKSGENFEGNKNIVLNEDTMKKKEKFKNKSRELNDRGNSKIQNVSLLKTKNSSNATNNYS